MDPYYRRAARAAQEPANEVMRIVTFTGYRTMTFGSLICNFLALTCAGLSSLGTVRAEPPEFKAGGNWLGTLPIPSGEIRFVFRIAEGPGGRLSAVADSPDQEVFDIPVDQVICANRSIRMRIQALHGGYEGAFTTGDTIDGKLIQGNKKIPLPLKRVDNAPLPPKRPQNPIRPFPYDEQEVVVDNAGIKLAGTLTLPRAQGPFPAVILLTGSETGFQTAERQGEDCREAANEVRRRDRHRGAQVGAELLGGYRDEHGPVAR